MFQPMLAMWPAALLALLTLTVSAQTPTSPAGTAAPKQAAAAPYKSALESYEPFSENKPLPWREANDTVGKVGGWRAYAKEAHEAPAAAAPAPAATGTADPHAGHAKPQGGKK